MKLYTYMMNYLNSLKPKRDEYEPNSNMFFVAVRDIYSILFNMEK